MCVYVALTSAQSVSVQGPYGKKQPEQDRGNPMAGKHMNHEQQHMF